MTLLKALKYVAIFLWAVLFLYYFKIYMPKNVWYLIIGIPSLAISSYMINKLFNKIQQKLSS